MDIRLLKIAELKSAPYNPRITLRPGMPAYERLARSIDEFDLVQPIVWNETTGHVVAGHQRLEVLKQRGAVEVSAVVVALPLEREKALNVALNNAQVGGDWDPELLADLLTELSELPDFDATLTGFDERYLRDLLLQPDPQHAAEDNDVHPQDVVRVSLEISTNDWEDVRHELDAIVADYELTIHVKLPE